MSNYLITDTLMTDIADAIRAKTGGSSPIQGSDFPTAIANITELLTLTYANKTNAPNTHNAIIRDWDFNGEVLKGPVCYLSDGNTPYSEALVVNRHVRNFTLGDDYIPYYAFFGSKILDIGDSLPSGVTGIGTYAFASAYTSTTVYDDNGNAITAHPITSLPSTLLTIADGAFMGCDLLTLSTLPSQVYNISQSAFRESGVTFSSLPDAVRNVGQNGFYKCPGITEMKLSRSMSRLYASFVECRNLRKVFIPSNIVRTEASVFKNCSSLAHIYCEASSAPTNWNADWSANTGTSPRIHWGATEAQYDAA